MKIRMGALLLLLLLPLACAAQANAWDFVHTAIRISTPAQIEELLETSGCDFGKMQEEPSAYYFEKPTVWGLSAKALVLLEMPYPELTGFYCNVIFDAPAGSNLGNPGEAYAALSDMFRKKYGKPSDVTQTVEERTSLWHFQDALVTLTWWINPDTGLPETRCAFAGTRGDPDSPRAQTRSFPFEPLALLTPPEAATAFSVLKVSPGMTQAQVIAAMGHEPDSIKLNALVYANQRVALHYAHIAYRFLMDADTLDSVLIQFIVDEEAPDECIEDYAMLKAVLTGYHGSPLQDNTTWDNERYKNNPAEHSKALRAGDVSYDALWQVGETRIMLNLFLENDQITHSLLYFFNPDTAPAPLLPLRQTN